MTSRDCALSQSRMLVVDELTARDKQATLPWCDFIEALCRLADATQGFDTPSNTFGPFLKQLFIGLSKTHNGQLKVRKHGSAEDGKVAIDLDALLQSRARSARSSSHRRSTYIKIAL